MPYSAFKKVGLLLGLLLCTFIVPVVYAESLFLEYGNTSLTISTGQLSMTWLSLYAGALLALIIYNSLLFIALRNRNYLYLTLLTGAILLVFCSFNQSLFELLRPNSPQWHNIFLLIGLTLSGIFATQFSRSFLADVPPFPKLDTIFNGLSWGFIIILIANLFTAPPYALPITALLIFILCVTTIVASTLSTLKNNPAMQIYLIAWLSLLSGLLLFASYKLGWLPDLWITRYALVVGTMLYVLFLAFALAHRIIITHHQTTQFHQQIEAESEVNVAQQVSEQTKELTQLNEKLHKQEDVLKKLAFYDSLTNLANRTFIHVQLKQLLSQSRRNKTKVSVLLLDLDDFKPINDEYGQQVGDEVLITTANRLQSTLRQNDVVGRLNCDKFIVLLESTQDDRHEPKEVADRISASISQPIPKDWFILNLKASIGIANYPKDGSDAKSLISAADAAMRIEKSKKKPKRQ